MEPSDRVKGGRPLLRLVPDPETAPLVVKIFEKYLAGHGLRSVATWLNEEVGARSSMGQRFDSVKVTRILQNPMYLGLLLAGPRGGERRLVPSTHEPLISAEMFDRVQETFEQRKMMAPRQATGAFVLSGVARCGVCGGAICVQKAAKNSRQAGQYWYKCRNYNYARGCGPKGKALTSAPGPAMEQKVVEAIVALGHPDALDAFYGLVEADYEARLGMTVDEVEEVDREITQAGKAIQRWDQLYETGQLEMAEYLQRVQPHKERIRVLRDRLEAVKKTPAPPPKEVLANFVVTFPEIWAEADPHERKALLQHFVNAWDVTIYLYPGQRLEVRTAHRPADGPSSTELAD